MDRRTALLLGAAAALAACAKPAPAPVGSDGKPLPQVYAIKPGDESAILYRMLDADGYPNAFINVGNLRLEFTRASRKPDSTFSRIVMAGNGFGF